MSLKLGIVKSSVDFRFEATNTGFDITKMGNDSLDNQIQHNVATIGKGFIKQYTISVGATQDIDLFSGLLDPVNESAAMVKIASVMIFVSSDSPNGGDLLLRASPSNGLTGWIVRSSGDLWIPAGGHANFGVPDAKAITVGSTNRNIRLVQSGASPTLVKIVLFGG